MSFNKQEFKRYYLFMTIVIPLFILFSALLISGVIQPHVGTASIVKARVDWIDGNDSGQYAIVYS